MEMSWQLVIFAALASGAAAGLINLVPFLRDTSFDDIAHNYEVWVVLALWIISNARTPKEAAWKTFVFFLISQPLIYLIEAPVFGWQVFSAYPFWLLLTLCTWPAGWACWYIGKQSWIGVGCMFAADAVLIMEGSQYLWVAINQFPRQILAVIFCYGSALLLPVLFYPLKKRLLLIYGLEVPMLILSLAMGEMTHAWNRIIATYKIPNQSMSFEAAKWKAEADNEDFFHVHGIEGNYVKISALKSAPFPGTITCKSSDGQTVRFRVEVKGNTLSFTPIDQH